MHLAVGLSGHSGAVVLPVDGLDELGEGDDPRDFWADAPFADTPGGRAAELLEQGAGRRKLAAGSA